MILDGFLILSVSAGVIIQAKWNPIAFNVWEDPSGAMFSFEADSKLAPDIISSAIAKSYFLLDLIRASKHHNGSGLENGIDVDLTMQLKRVLVLVLVRCWTCSAGEVLRPPFQIHVQSVARNRPVH